MNQMHLEKHFKCHIVLHVQDFHSSYYELLLRTLVGVSVGLRTLVGVSVGLRTLVGVIED